jgi:DNA-binding SARP family transcriptional activator
MLLSAEEISEQNARQPLRLFVGPRAQISQGVSESFDVTGKAALLLAMLAFERQLSRLRASQMLWPDSSQTQARNNLRTLIHRLNRRIGAELVIGGEGLSVDSSIARFVLPDADSCLAALQTGGPQCLELLAQADVDGEGSDAVKEWLDRSRQRMRQQLLGQLSEKLRLTLTSSDPDRAIALARACVQLEPLSEHWHRQLMDTLAQCGDRAAALAAYEDCKERLLQQLGVLPDTRTRTLQLRILQGRSVGPPLVEPQTRSVASSIDARLTPFEGAARYPLVERETVLAELRIAFAQGRHVVLHGEAGVGKTRLLRELPCQAEIEHVAIRLSARQEPYAALAQILQEVQHRRQPCIGLPEQIELARLAPLAFPDVLPSQSSLAMPRLHAALRHWAVRLREAGVHRLVLDDVHHADAASQAAIAAVVPNPGGVTVPALLLAYRSGEVETVLSDALVAAQVLDRAKSITLQRLTVRGVKALLELMHDEQADPAEVNAAQLFERTGGNPLFVIELAQHGIKQADAVAAENVGALLCSRIAACSEAARQLAVVAAVAAQDFSVELAAAVTGQSALAMMPAWSELQQRGLFADHGLAHDLVREAALVKLASAIRRQLHRQVAEHLESQGLMGTRVLVHWLGAEDYDHALPHLLNQLRATSVAGLSTVQIEKELLDILGRLSDAALLDHLWLTAEIDGAERDDVLRTQWPVLEALVERVERMTRPEGVGHWLSYERARLRVYRDKQPGLAYEELGRSVARMSERGLERARSELLLSLLGYLSTGAVHEHPLRAKAAVVELAGQPQHVRLLKAVELNYGFAFDVVNFLRTKMSTLRAARARHDLAAVDATRAEIALQCSGRGCVSSAYRYFSIESRARQSDERAHAEDGDPFILGIAALNAGRYAQAIRFLELSRQRVFSQSLLALAQTALYIHLGQWQRARTQLKSIDANELKTWAHYLRMYCVAGRQIDLHEGVDPLPASGQAHAIAVETGVSGFSARLFDWELALVAADPHVRVTSGTRLLADMLDARADHRRRLRLLLEVAEAHSQVGSAQGRILLLEAARELRRGRTTFELYLPEGLERCARLLEPTDPTEACALLYVARRWVRQALPHVPAFAQSSFTNDVPTNQRLLGSHVGQLVKQFD